MNALIQIIDNLQEDFHQTKTQFIQILNSQDDPKSCLSQFNSLLSTINVKKSASFSSTIFTSNLSLLSNKEVSIFYMQLFMILSKSLYCTDLNRLVEENKVFELIIKEIQLNLNEKKSEHDLSLVFGGLDYTTKIGCYFEFLEFLTQLTWTEIEFSTENFFISLIFKETSDLNLQSMFFKSYTKGLRFMRLCNNYYRSLKICGKLISEHSQELSTGFFKLFKYLLLKVNKNSSVSVVKKKFHCVTSSEIIGLDSLVTLFYNSEKPLYLKSKTLICSLFTCFSQKCISDIEIILNHSFSILVNLCDKSQKTHKKRLISLIKFLVEIIHINFKNNNNFQVIAEFKGVSKIINLYSPIRVMQVRNKLLYEFGLKNEIPLIKIKNKQYGPQKSIKKLKLNSGQNMSFSIIDDIIEPDFISINHSLAEMSEFFWALFDETPDDDFNESCFKIAKIITGGPIYKSVIGYDFCVENFISSPISVQMEFVYSMSLRSKFENWLGDIVSLGYHNPIFEYLIGFLEKNPNFRMVGEVIDLFLNFTKIDNLSNELFLRVSEALFLWIFNIKSNKIIKQKNSYYNDTLIIIFRRLESTCYDLIKKLIEGNIDSIANYLPSFLDHENLYIPLLILKNKDPQLLNLISQKLVENLTILNIENVINLTTFFKIFDYPLNLLINKVISILINSQQIENEQLLLVRFIALLSTYSADYKMSLSDFQNFLNSCLIPNPSNHSPNLPLLKNKNLRVVGFEIILAQCKSDFNKVHILNDTLSLLLINKSWRRSKLSFWKIKPNSLNSSGEYKGIENPGTICYSNCFIQQLFHMPTFVDPILSLYTEEKNCLSALQKVFVKLKFSSQSSVSSNGLIKSCIGPKGLYEQMDTDEYILKLFEKCSKSEVGYQFDEIVEKNFIGVQNLEIRCKRCQKVTNNTQDFKSVGLQIFKKEKNNVLNSLRKMTDGENMTGENALFCSNCKRKENSETRIKFTKLPLYLIFIVKRFEYDTKIMTRVKVNEVFEFTEEVNLMEFVNSNSSDCIKENFDYQLKGVINHMGTAEIGHYTSYVRTLKNEWVNFNDSDVSMSSLTEVLKNSFGDPQGNFSKTSAYIIIYQKLNKPDTFSNPKNFNLTACENKYLPKITEKNREIKFREILFSDGFLESIIKFINFEEIQIFLINYCLSCFFRMEIMTIQKMSIYREFYSNLNLNAVKHLIQILSSPLGVQEFILSNPHPEHKTFLVTLIKKHVKSLEKNFLLLTFKRLINVIAEFSISLNKCDIYLSQLFFFIVNNLEEDWKTLYIRDYHFNLFIKKKQMITKIDIETFKSDFFWTEDFEYLDESNDLDRYIERCPCMFFRFMVKNFKKFDLVFLEIVKNKHFIEISIQILKSKLGIIAFSQLYSEVYKNNTKGALDYLGIIISKYTENSNEKYLKFVSMFFKYYQGRNELFIHFIEHYFDFFQGNNNKESNLFIRYTIKSLRKVKYNEIALILIEETHEKLKNAIEIYLCQYEDEVILRKISQDFFNGIESELFDADDEIHPKYLEKKKVAFITSHETLREYEVDDNFCNKIIRFENMGIRVLLLDYIHFEKIKFIN